MSSKQRTAAFLERFSRGQHETAATPNLGTRRYPNQQNTFSASSASIDFVTQHTEEEKKIKIIKKLNLRQEEKESAMFHIRTLIKARNNVLRQVMTKHRHNKGMQTQLKQAQKRHNGVVLHLILTHTANSGSSGGRR